MKTTGKIERMMLLLLLLLTPGALYGAFQDPLAGQWEGNFMGDFRTVVSFST